MTLPQNNSAHWRPLLIPLIVSGLVCVGLYGWFPYNFGYDLKAVPVFRALWQMWWDADAGDWGHCKLVPLISLGLVWWQSRQLAAVPFRSDLAPGVLALLLAGLFYWVGYKIDVMVCGFLSFQFTLAALIVWFCGLPFMRAVFFPWIFLIFAWPMPFISTSGLRMLMTKLSVHLLNLIGMDSIQHGTAILSAPHFEYSIRPGQLFQLEVAAACSGLRSLFALMMLAALAGYLTLRQPWQRWLLFACAVPLAVAGNIIRIVLLAFGAQMFGASFAIGTEQQPSFYHLFAGFMVFAVALGGMFLIGWLLNGGWQKLLPRRREEI
ncbi:MAG: exosortase/archaeosortase family protein [Verrucomicrobiales bacterium]|jgi:exosortase|nr:exosortase/archaeosortase family protein [Verrucomicrobiales bacterium]